MTAWGEHEDGAWLQAALDAGNGHTAYNISPELLQV